MCKLDKCGEPILHKVGHFLVNVSMNRHVKIENLKATLVLLGSSTLTKASPSTEMISGISYMAKGPI